MLRRTMITIGAALALLIPLSLGNVAEASVTCVGLHAGPPWAYQMSSFSVNDPTWPIQMPYIPYGWPNALYCGPCAPSQLYGFYNTYFGPTAIAWVNIGYIPDAHYLGGPNILVMWPSALGWTGPAYSCSGI